MKKLFALLLAAVLCAGVLTAAAESIAVPRATAFPGDAPLAPAEGSNIWDAYGMAVRQNQGGLCLYEQCAEGWDGIQFTDMHVGRPVRLYDMDGDGTEEMILASAEYTSNDFLPEIRLLFYRWDGTRAVNFFNLPLGAGLGGGGDFSVDLCDGQVCVRESFNMDLLWGSVTAVRPGALYGSGERLMQFYEPCDPSGMDLPVEGGYSQIGGVERGQEACLTWDEDYLARRTPLLSSTAEVGGAMTVPEALALLQDRAYGAQEPPADAAWVDVYARFLAEERWRTLGGEFTEDTGEAWERPMTAGLYDMDRDGVPELILYNGSDDEAGAYCCLYTARGDDVVFLGTLGRRECQLEYFEDPELPGLLCTDGNMGTYETEYYTLENGSLHTTAACLFETRFDEETMEPQGCTVTREDASDALWGAISRRDPLYAVRMVPLADIAAGGISLLTDAWGSPDASGTWDFIGFLETGDGPDDEESGGEHGLENPFNAGETVDVWVPYTYANGSQVSWNVPIVPGMFEQDSTVYHRDLSLLAIVLSNAAYDSVDQGITRGTCIVDAYKALGVREEDIMLFNYRGNRLNVPTFDAENREEFSIASLDTGMGYHLLFVVFRGSGEMFESDDWRSNLSVAWEESVDYMGVRIHPGFSTYLKLGESGLKHYLTEHPDLRSELEAGRVKVLVTGHSLGGGTANLMGARLSTREWADRGFRTDDTYVYGFAAPRVFLMDDESDPQMGRCANVISVVIDEDIVPKIPSDFRFWVKWRRFGKTYQFATPLHGTLFAPVSPGDHHMPVNYLTVVDSAQPNKTQLDETDKGVSWSDLPS